MYNNGQYDKVNDNRFDAEVKRTPDYYRNDVKPYGSSGSLEDMLFFNDDRGAANKQAASKNTANQTMYAEPEASSETDFERKFYTEEYARPEVSPAQSVREYHAEDEAGSFSEDACPSVTTMQFKEMAANPYEDYRGDAEERTDARFHINTKTKIIAAVYALVVMTVLVLIILNTRLLKDMNSQITSQENEISALMAENETFRATLQDAMNAETIDYKAMEMGMVHD